MSIKNHMDRVNSILHTLATAEVVENTFGMVSTIHRELQSILQQLPGSKSSTTLGEEMTEKLRELTHGVEEGRMLFGIPEQWLIDNVMATAKRIRDRLDA